MSSLLISSTYFPPQVGGISQMMWNIATSLGPDRVCCLTGVSADRRSVARSFEPRVYRRPAVFAKSKYIQATIGAASLIEIMIRERPQVLQLATVYEYALGLLLRRWLKLPFIVYANGNEILDALQNSWHKPRLALQHADRVIAISRFTAGLVQKAGVPSHRIEIVHPGCDIDRFRPMPAKIELRTKLLVDRCKDRVVLTVGNLVARKGHDVIIRSLPRLLKTVVDVTYLIIGDGPYRRELERLAVAMGVKDHVIFQGKVPDEDLPDIYAVSDVFVMPSREHLEACDVEGFGIVFLEASACGKPVIGGRSGGIPDAIEEGVTGLLVDPLDSDDVADAMTRILLDRELSDRLGRQGRARAVREFSWSQAGAKIQGILDSVVREQECPRSRSE